MNKPKQTVEGSCIARKQDECNKFGAEELRSIIKTTKAAEIALEMAKARAWKTQIACTCLKT